MNIFLVSKDDGLVLFSNISHIPIHPFTFRKAKIPQSFGISGCNEGEQICLV